MLKGKGVLCRIKNKRPRPFLKTGWGAFPSVLRLPAFVLFTVWPARIVSGTHPILLLDGSAKCISLKNRLVQLNARENLLKNIEMKIASKSMSRR